MNDKRNNLNIGTKTLSLGDSIYDISKIFDSQSKPKMGRYKLEKVNLSKIDVVFNKISNREYFWWENRNGIDWIVDNFYKTPPVILEKMGELYYSVDGHHRITAAIEIGLTNILSLVIEVNELSYPRNP